MKKVVIPKLGHLQKASIAGLTADTVVGYAGLSVAVPEQANLFLTAASICGAVNCACYFLCGSDEEEAAKHPLKVIGQHVGTWALGVQSLFWLGAGLFSKGFQQAADAICHPLTHMGDALASAQWQNAFIGAAGLFATFFPSKLQDPKAEDERLLNELPAAVIKGDFKDAGDILKNLTQFKKSGLIFMATCVALGGANVAKVLTGIEAHVPPEELFNPAMLLAATGIYVYGNSEMMRARRSSLKAAVDTLIHHNKV